MLVVTSLLRRWLTAVAVVVGCTTSAAAGELLCEGFAAAVRGDYGLGHDITTVAVVNRVAWSERRWSLELTVPVLYQSSSELPWSAGRPLPGGHGPGRDDGGQGGGGGRGGGGGHGGGGGGGGGTPDPDPVPGDSHDLGFGDPSLRGTLELLDPTSRFGALALVAAVKTPLASTSSGFGTGKWDVGTSLLWQPPTESLAISVEVGHWWLGDPPAVALDDVVVGRLRVGAPIGASSYRWEARLWGNSAAAAEVADAASLGFEVARSLDVGRAVFVAVEVGLTSGAPDAAVAVGFRATL